MAGVFFIVMLIAFGLIAFMMICLWKIVEKGGNPGWTGIVPIYNMFILAKMAQKPEWWGALVLIPYAGIVFQIWIWNRVVKRFGYSEGFTVGIVLLPIVFLPILAFGDAQYRQLEDDFQTNLSN
ncbi:MAG: hypothetical protein KDD41_08990 [Flavobacteriales bacterium]|nr:hypothetical protein [Flavobacteriales bacterium]